MTVTNGVSNHFFFYSYFKQQFKRTIFGRNLCWRFAQMFSCVPFLSDVISKYSTPLLKNCFSFIIYSLTKRPDSFSRCLPTTVTVLLFRLPRNFRAHNKWQSKWKELFVYPNGIHFLFITFFFHFAFSLINKLIWSIPFWLRFAWANKSDRFIPWNLYIAECIYLISVLIAKESYWKHWVFGERSIILAKEHGVINTVSVTDWFNQKIVYLLLNALCNESTNYWKIIFRHIQNVI